MKNLSSYLMETGTAQAEIAELVGASKSHISDILSKRREPSIDLALRIERATGGIVAVETWPKFSGLAHRANGAA